MSATLDAFLLGRITVHAPTIRTFTLAVSLRIQVTCPFRSLRQA